MHVPKEAIHSPDCKLHVYFLMNNPADPLLSPPQIGAIAWAMQKLRHRELPLVVFTLQMTQAPFLDPAVPTTTARGQIVC